MTELSQYFKGRTVQEQMNEVIGYVDARAEEVAAAKADDVLVPAEQAKDDAIAAKEAAEGARDTTLAALPQIQQDITDLKAEDVALDRRLDNVELKVQTAEGNIVTIQGQITNITSRVGTLENKMTTAESNITLLQSAAALSLNTVDNQNFAGIKTALNYPVKNQRVSAQNEDGWHMMYSWNAGSTTANLITVFLVRFKQLTNGFGILLVDVRSTNTNLTWLVKGSGIPDDSVIVARKYDNSTAYLYVNGYRLELECWGCSRATSTNPIEVSISENPETTVLEPTTTDFDTVVKI